MWRMIGCSRLMPLAPRIVRAVRATSSAMRVGALGQRDLLLPERAGVLQSAELVRQQLGLGDRGQLVDQLVLGSWKPRSACRTATAGFGVGQRAFVAGHRRADHAPDDPEAGLVEAAQRRPEALAPGSSAVAGRRMSSKCSSEVTEARSESLSLTSRVLKPVCRSRPGSHARLLTSEPRPSRRRPCCRW